MTIDYEIEPVQKPKLNPWFSIWTKPRATIAQIVREDPEKNVALLVSVGGILQALSNATGSEAMSPVGIILLALIAGPIGAIITWYIAGFGLCMIGNWLGGTADEVQVRAALAWSNVPFIWLAPITIIFVLLSEPFNLGGSNFLVDTVLALGGLVILIVAFWSVVIYCKCLGEVQGFSAWRAWGSYIIGVLIIVLPFTLCGVFVGIF